jgi:hypothetical protein
MSKAHLHRLIDGLPENKVPQVQAYLEIIHAGGLKELLARAPEEDEEISPEEEAAVREAEADITANGTISHQDVRKMLGL